MASVQAPKHAEWLDPLNKMIWQTVFKERGTEMTLRDGRVFSITYTVKEVVSLDHFKSGKTEMAWVRPKYNPLVPCGWFRVDEVLNTGWYHASTS